MVTKKFPGMILAVVGLTLAAGHAAAADAVGSISDIKGNALLDQGSDFISATLRSPLRQGDRLITMEKARLTVKFLDGCTYTMSENQILNIGAANSCKTGKLAVRQVSPTLAVAHNNVGAAALPAHGAGGAGAGAGGSGTAGGAGTVGTAVAGVASALGITTTALVAGTAVVVVGATAAIANDSSSDDNPPPIPPVSP